MRKKNFLFTGASVLFMSLLLVSCVKDDCKRLQTYSYYEPVFVTMPEMRAQVKSGPPTDIVNPGKLFLLGDYIFLSEFQKGIHIINNQNPRAPQNVAFISIPGNVDMAARGNALYADLYTDLVTLDISNPAQVIVKDHLEGVFPDRYFQHNTLTDSGRVIVNFIRHDTTIIVDCNNPAPVNFMDNSGAYMTTAATGNNAFSAAGIGGSMARFAISDNHMYTVSNNNLRVFDVSADFKPDFKKMVPLNNWNIETIFPLKNKLFIGSMTGMYIYNIDRPEDPVLSGEFAHVNSCDPVIADDHYAYVTLRSGTQCQGFTNQLEVLQLNNYTNPSLLRTYPMTNPHGLSKADHLLFICDGPNGLKVYDASVPSNLKEVMHYPGIETYDVIAHAKTAIVVAKDGLYQFDFSNVRNIRLISKISIIRQ